MSNVNDYIAGAMDERKRIKKELQDILPLVDKDTFKKIMMIVEGTYERNV